MPQSITFGLGPEFLWREGLTDTVAPWEDGLRAETGRSAFEWWYFDAYLLTLTEIIRADSRDSRSQSNS